MSHQKGNKLQKVLADAGLGARREMERWIEAGRVTVNGKRAELGIRVRATDAILIDGQRLITARPLARQRRVLCYHKPEGEVCTRRDPQGRPTVFEHLPALKRGRWIAIGRLDVSSSGLLLFSNEGALAHRLMHPSSGVEREYAVRVLGQVTDQVLARLKAGVMLPDGLARFEAIREVGGTGANRWYHVTLREGRNRQVRRVWASQGLPVTRLIRIRFGPVKLRRGLRSGHWKELSTAAVAALVDGIGMPSAPEASPETAKAVAVRHRRPPRRRVVR